MRFGALVLAATLLPAPALAGPAGTLQIATSDGRALEGGAAIESTDLLVFEVSGTEDSYLYVVEKGEGHLALIHPHVGYVLPGTAVPTTLRPQPTWLTEADQERAGWLPEVHGTVEYLLVSSPIPRDAPSDHRLVSLDQLLAPPPYVKGPAGEAATVVARSSITRAEPDEQEPDEREPDEQEPDEPGDSGEAAPEP
ncbi:MAG: hypothetical protein KDA24_21330 [Deltaproteobacteria bacterium]|nr:hypothetical protein [Deltaproteobacteria bacterium]